MTLHSSHASHRQREAGYRVFLLNSSETLDECIARDRAVKGAVGFVFSIRANNSENMHPLNAVAYYHCEHSEADINRVKALIERSKHPFAAFSVLFCSIHPHHLSYFNGKAYPEAHPITELKWHGSADAFLDEVVFKSPPPEQTFELASPSLPALAPYYKTRQVAYYDDVISKDMAASPELVFDSPCKRKP